MRSKQQWTIGQIIRVGFMNDLKVLDIVVSPNDYLKRKAYLLGSPKQLYVFTPHAGIQKIGMRAWRERTF